MLELVKHVKDYFTDRMARVLTSKEGVLRFRLTRSLAGQVCIVLQGFRGGRGEIRTPDSQLSRLSLCEAGLVSLRSLARHPLSYTPDA